MPDILITRKVYTPKSTMGEISIGGEFHWWSLERQHRGANRGVLHPCIDPGRYGASIYRSPHQHQDVILLHDVPRRNFIEMHPFNYPYETEGCIAPGHQRGEDCVLESRVAFDELMGIVRPWAAIFVVILDTMYDDDMERTA